MISVIVINQRYLCCRQAAVWLSVDAKRSNACCIMDQYEHAGPWRGPQATDSL